MIKIGSSYKNKLGYEFIVVDIVSAKNVLVRFIRTGYETRTQAVKIMEGSVKDVFEPVYFGVGYYGSKQRELDNAMPALRVWRHMLYRCYAEKAKLTHPTYGECTVCDEWHNFTNFYHWYKENYIEGYHLDKDIKVPGNKVYSPETCMFVSHTENIRQSHSKTYLVTHPCGKNEIVSPLVDFCRKHNLSQPNLNKVINGERAHHKGFKAKLIEEGLFTFA
ncbi:hypothetical protein ACPD0L_000751 [Vibrio cholerae]